MLRDPERNADIELLGAESTLQFTDFWLGFEALGQPVVLPRIFSPERTVGNVSGMGYYTPESTGWKGFERMDSCYPYFPAMPSDVHGYTHYMAESCDYGGDTADMAFIYFVGKGLDWKMTPVVGNEIAESVFLKRRG